MANEDPTALKAAIRTWAVRVLDASLAPTADAMRADAPVGTPTPTSTRPPGQLRDSIAPVKAHVTLRGASGRIVAPVIQAATTDRGARPHVIVPRRAARLRFWAPAEGRVVYARKVNHPGNPPRPWWEESLRRHWPRELRAAARRVRF